MKKEKIAVFVLISALLLTLNGCLRSADGSDVEKENNVIEADIVSSLPSEENNEQNETETVQQPVETVDPQETQNPQIPEEDDVIETGIPDENGTVPVAKIGLDRYEININVGQTDMPWETIYPTNATDKSTYWNTSDPTVASVDSYGRITGISEGKCTVTTTSSSDPDVSSVVNVTVKKAPALTEPTYIDGIMIANKSYPLPSTYNPGVDKEAGAALEEMINAAKNDGISLWIVSGFRSYSTQQTLYSNYLLREGRDAADRYSARPGYSEHQTGLAFDLNSLEISFGETKEGKWLSSHCAEYGFIIRYPSGKEEQTGYQYEPWHVRYLGVDKAKSVYESGLCLEEYLGITSEYAD